MSVAWVFPGQGSQKIGMADEIISLPKALERFELASELLNRDLLQICKGNSSGLGQLDDLNDTRNTQPAMFIIQSLLGDDLKKQGRKPSLVAGHSLGEIAALYISEVINLQDALSLLKTRSELMAEAGGGSMAAIMGFNKEQLYEVVSDIEGVVIANDNSNDQVVLSGTPIGVNSAIERIDCKRSVLLKVSGAFHSPLMLKAAEAFAFELDKIVFKDSIYPVASNVDPEPSQDGIILKERLKEQMTKGVRWREIMDIIGDSGINTLVEIGPGKVLSGLAKRSITGVSINQISSSSDLGY